MRNSFWKLALAIMVVSAPGMARAQGGTPHGGMTPPFAGGKMGNAKPMTLAEALKAAPQLDKSLIPLEKAMDTAAAKMKKSPKDASAKKAYVEATYKYGHAVEYSKAIADSRVRYRASLVLYRKALAVDPKHQPSLTEKDQIEAIYKSMPGGVPTK